MDAELKQYLERIEASVGDLRASLAETEVRIMERLDGRLDAVETRLKEFAREADRDLETKIIAEFWKWGRTSE